MIFTKTSLPLHGLGYRHTGTVITSCVQTNFPVKGNMFICITNGYLLKFQVCIEQGIEVTVSSTD